MRPTGMPPHMSSTSASVQWAGLMWFISCAAKTPSGQIQTTRGRVLREQTPSVKSGSGLEGSYVREAGGRVCELPVAHLVHQIAQPLQRVGETVDRVARVAAGEEVAPARLARPGEIGRVLGPEEQLVCALVVRHGSVLVPLGLVPAAGERAVDVRVERLAVLLFGVGVDSVQHPAPRACVLLDVAGQEDGVAEAHGGVGSEGRAPDTLAGLRHHAVEALPAAKTIRLGSCHSNHP